MNRWNGHHTGEEVVNSAVDRNGPIILFDGVYYLCTDVVRLVIHRGRRR